MSLRDIPLDQSPTELSMTPMIDIVFNLLSFFIITFKIPSVEGDFNIKMPVNVQSNQVSSMEEELTPIEIRLTAGSMGELSGIIFGSKDLGTDMHALRSEVFNYLQIDPDAGMMGSEDIRDNQEVELNCDEELHYHYAIDAMTAVTGYVNADNQIVKLIEKVKFTPPK